ncbi:MAG: hypothetical protein H3Z50_05145 [archaeon]|nr:hypothetical protein [archaeon]MCP8306861.1 hypothetical protein [archaeon]
MENDIESVQIKKILLALDRAKSPVPLGYISLHTEIEEPHGILEKMEEKGLVRRCLLSYWPDDMHPLYEITPKTQKELGHILF